VAFAGGDRRRFDLVVGADGLHSALRAMVFGPHERFLRHLGHVLAFYSVPNEFGLDRWLLEYQDQESGRSALLRPIQDATRAMAMFYFASADFDVDYRDVAAQKVLLRERMAGLGWLTPDILAHLDDTPDFNLDQVAQVVMDRWSSGPVGLLGDAAFSSSPMSGQGTGLALVGAYLLAGELAAAGWDPDAGFARYEARMRSFVEANQEIGRLNARSRDVPGPDAEPSPDFASEWFTELVGRAINGIELPDYAGCRTPQPLPDRRSPRRPSRRCHITGKRAHADSSSHTGVHKSRVRPFACRSALHLSNLISEPVGKQGAHQSTPGGQTRPPTRSRPAPPAAGHRHRRDPPTTGTSTQPGNPRSGQTRWHVTTRFLATCWTCPTRRAAGLSIEGRGQYAGNRRRS
jgi:hypothetical protein